MNKIVSSGLLVTTLVLSAFPASAVVSSWTPPVNLSLSGGVAETPQVVLDSTGRAIAVWLRDNGDVTVVQASTRPSGGAWSEPIDLSETDSYGPQIVVDSSGLATAVWNQSGEDDEELIWTATSQSGEGWSNPRPLSVPGTISNYPQLAVDSTGLVTAIWQSDDGTDIIIQSSTSQNGEDWSPIEDVSLTGGSAYYPAIALGPSGLAVAVWVLNDGNYTIQSSASLTVGEWSDPETLGEGNDSFVAKPQVKVDSTGRAIALWSSYEESIYTVEYATSPNGIEDWTPSEPLSQPGADGTRPQITVDSTDLFTAIWLRDDENGDDDIVQSSTSQGGGDWSETVNLTEPGQDAGLPQVAVDSTGLVTAIWRREDVNGDDDLIQVSTRSRAGEWSSPIDLSEPGEPSFDPQVALDSSGNATAIWSRRVGPDDIIQSSSLFRTAITPTATTTTIPKLASTGANVELLVVSGFIAALAGAGFLTASRRKHTA
jgi:LPXTG-motif cell wall-anchored protein